MIPLIEEDLHAEAKPWPSASRQESLTQAPGVALQAQATANATATASVEPGGLCARPGLQESYQEAGEEALEKFYA